MKTIFKLSFIAALFMLTSCSLEKRHYRSGYSINWNSAKRNNVAKKNITHEETQSDITGNDAQTAAAEVAELPVTASAEAIAPTVVKQESLLKPKALPKDSCDVIEMRSGKKILANIHEINPSTVKYKNCGDSSGPDRIIEKEEIASITYANGTKESDEQLRVTRKKEVEGVRPPEQERTSHYSEPHSSPSQARRMGLSSVILGGLSILLLAAGIALIYWGALAIDIGGGILGILFGIILIIAAFVLSILAVVNAAISLVMAHNDKDNKQNNTLGYVGLCLGLVFPLALLIALVISGL